MIEPLANLHPVRLNVQLTKRCNQRCRLCNSYNFRPDHELTEDEVRRLISVTCASFDIKNIAFTGGEPTLRADIERLAAFASRHCENVSITTNGTFIRDEASARSLLDSGIRRFTFSYHGIGEHSAFVRVKSAEERIRHALGVMSRLAKEYSAYVKIGMLLTDASLQSAERMLQYCKELGFVLYVELPDGNLPIFRNGDLCRFQVSANAVPKALEMLTKWVEAREPVSLTREAMLFVERYLKGERIRGACPLGRTDIYTDSVGNIFTGCWVLASVGNMRERELDAIFRSDQYRANVDRMERRECPGCTCGYLMQAKYMTA